MSFIGIFTNNKNFDILKAEIVKGINVSNLNIININKQSIDNMKNVKFETIIIDKSLKGLEEYMENIKKICQGAKYILCNSDENIGDIDFIENEKIEIITYGLNQKAFVTISSIGEENVLVALQKNFKNIDGKLIEVGECNIDLRDNNKLNISNILVLYIIFTIYRTE